MSKNKKDKRVDIYISRSPKGYAYNAGETVKVSPSIAEKLKEMNCGRDPKKTLPQDIPYRKQLIAGGLETVADVEEAKDLTKVKGIGDAAEKEIAEYLAG